MFEKVEKANVANEMQFLICIPNDAVNSFAHAYIFLELKKAR